MSDSDAPDFVQPIAMLFMIIAGVGSMWTKFFSEVTVSREQLQGVCFDGRLRNQSYIDAEFQVDDTHLDGDSGLVVMNCLFDVAVYPCPDGEDTCTEWDIGEEPLPPRQKTEETSVKCKRQGSYFPLGYNACRDARWVCEAGPCDAYGKTTRLCPSKLEDQSYSCFYVPGNPSAGVRTTQTGFPIWWLIGSILALVCAVPCSVMFGWVLVKEWQRHGFAGCVKSFGFVIGVVVCIVLLGVVTTSIHPTKTAKGPLDARVSNTTHITPWGVTYAHEEPAQDYGLPWYSSLLLVLGIIVCSVGLPISIVVCASRRSARAAEREPLLEA